MKAARWTGVIGLLAWLIFAAAVLLWPTPVDRPIDSELFRVLAWLHTHGAPRWIDYHAVEYSANVAFFAPLGLFLAVLLRGRRWDSASARFAVGLALGTSVGLVLSCLAEGAQAAFLPDRFATADDVAANTLGAFLGAVLAGLVPSRRKAEPVEPVPLVPRQHAAG